MQCPPVVVGFHLPWYTISDEVIWTKFASLELEILGLAHQTYFLDFRSNLPIFEGGLVERKGLLTVICFFSYGFCNLVYKLCVGPPYLYTKKTWFWCNVKSIREGIVILDVLLRPLNWVQQIYHLVYPIVLAGFVFVFVLVWL